MVKILFTADIQVKNREKSLYRSQEKTLQEIESILKETKAEIYLAAGDFWEFATPNDSERKLIYNHFARVIAIPTIKEVVLIAGNHDLEKEKKQLDTQVGFNPINIFADFVQNLDETLSKKIIYLRESKEYKSRVSNISYIAYSLEDEMLWRPIDGVTKRHPVITNIPNPNDGIRFNISVYHDILRDYVDETKLPIRKEKYNNIIGINDFESPLILAGDIHVNYKCTTLEGKTFMYPGSPIQHTHNEGSFLIIEEKCCHVKNADDKVVKLVTVDDINMTWSSEDIKLKNQICYNTIIFDNVSPLNCLQNLDWILGDIMFGEEQTFIKVKLSNVLLSKEMDIDCVLQTLGMKHKRVQTYFSYDKFVDLTKSANQQIINEIRSEVQAEQEIKNEETGDTETTINDLILDNNKLNRLFNKVLENYMPNIKNDLSSEITEEDIKDTVIKLFDEQLALAITNIQKYNIVFESIETNGFMKLGPNRIDLNIPGIVKITGTNGIGKTTLFHMLRWLLKDETFEGLKKNTKIKNTLIIFNDKNPEEDTVIVKGFQFINNTPVTITRTATRTWKKGVELKQKQALNWKDYISGVEKTITVTIIKDGKEITYTGDQAEKAISIWFGNTISTILFLNQPKILNILNLTPMELKELILNYIGVDYLEKLESNLELIKNDYYSVKPKRDKESIREALVDQKILLQNIDKEIEKSKCTIQESITSRDVYEKHKANISEKQIFVGNIPSLIEEKEKEIDDKQNQIDNFETREKKEKIPFNKQKPIEPNLVELRKSIEDSSKESIVLENESDNIVIIEEQLLTELLNSVDERFNKEDKDIETLINTEQSNIDKLNIQRKENFEIIINKLSDVTTALENNRDIIDKQVQKLNLDRQLTIQEIDKQKAQLLSGICKECKKPLHDDWEQHKNKYIDNLKMYEDMLLDIDNRLSEKNKALITATTIAKTYRNYHQIALKGILHNDYEKSKVTDFIIGINEDIKAIDNTITETNSKIKLLTDRRMSVASDANTIKLSIAGKKIDILKSLTEEVTEIDIIEKLIKYNKEKLEIKDKISQLSKSVEENNSKINELNKTYIDELKEYQECHDKVTKENDEIEEYNSNVDNHNSKLLIFKTEILTLKNSLLTLEGKLPEYTELNKKLLQINLQIEEYNNSILEAQKTLQESEIKKNTEEIKLTNLNQEYQDYIQYQKNIIIWKIYSNLIKTGFKDIVFEYYRSFLNNTLNMILEDVNFKLMWNNDGELYMIDFQDGFASYRPVQQTSGMETCFLGLTLIYTIHLLNIKNNISNIFIDELSGQLNKGNDLNYSAVDYQELFVMLLQKFKDKTIMIVDHNIKNLFESMTYEVQPANGGSKYQKII